MQFLPDEEIDRVHSTPQLIRKKTMHVDNLLFHDRVIPHRIYYKYSQTLGATMGYLGSINETCPDLLV